MSLTNGFISAVQLNSVITDLTTKADTRLGLKTATATIATNAWGPVDDDGTPVVDIGAVVQVTGLTDSDPGFVGIGTSATDTQRREIMKRNIRLYAQDGAYLLFAADTTPIVDIPINIIYQ